MNNLLNEFRSTSITWDKATRRIYSPITANESDSNGRKLNIQVVNSGQVENLTGATLHLYWETKDKAQHGLDAFTASDISKGEFEIFYTTGMLSNVGELNATLVLVDATGQVVSDWFKITVVRGIDGDAIQSENSFSSLTQALIDIRDLEQNYAPRLNDLTAQLQQTMNYSGQTDFVELIKGRTGYRRFRFKKRTNGKPSVYLDDGTNHITYEFTKNTNDDFWKIDVGYAGQLLATLVDWDDTVEGKRTGAWTISGNNHYTQEVGATFTTQVRGEEIVFSHFADSRSGRWRFVLNGDTTKPVIISTYSPTIVGVNYVTLFTGLDPDATHTVVGEFIGDDPNHELTGTPRGWVFSYPDSTERHSMMGYVKSNGSYNDGIMLLGAGSNKEFAFSMTKDGENQWFPEHNNIGTAFEVDPMKILVDGKEFDFENLQPNNDVFLDNWQMKQKVKCELPNVSGEIAIMDIVYTITKDGILSVSGSMEIIQDCKINGYPLMMPLNGGTINEIVSGMGTHKTSVGDSSNFFFDLEVDRVYSYAGIDERNKDYISALTIESPYRTLRLNEDGRNVLERFTYFQQRPTYPKLYFGVFSDYEAKAGYVYNFNGKYAVGIIPDIYRYVK